MEKVVNNRTGRTVCGIPQKRKKFKIQMPAIAASVMILYVVTGIFKQYILPGSMIKIAVLLAPPLALLITSGGIILSAYDILWMLTLPFLFFNNAALENGYYINVVCHLAITIFYIASRRYDGWMETVVKIIKFSSIVYAICTFWFLIDKGFYNRFIFGLFTKEDQASLLTNNALGYAAGLTGHYSHNAMYLSLGLGVFGCELIQNKIKRQNIIGFIICLAALLVTGKRGPSIFAVCSLVVAYYFFASNKPRSRWIKMILVLFLCLAGVFVVASFFPPILNVLERFKASQESGNIYNGRDILIELAVKLFKTNPVFGIGWYRYRYIHIQEYPWFPYMVHVHNVYVQLLCETGIVGFTLFLLFFISIYIMTIRLLINSRKKIIRLPERADYFLAFSVFIQTYFLLYSFTGNPLYDVMIQFPYLMFCGVPLIFKYKYVKNPSIRGRFIKIKF